MQVDTNARDNKKPKFKIMIVWLAIMLLASFAFSIHALQHPVNMKVLPMVPKQGEPLIVSFTLNNPGLGESLYVYELYINGENVMEGKSSIPKLSSKQLRYIYKNPLELGEQTNFLLRVKTPSDNIQKVISMPAYAPQVWTSFVSFASFSTSIASFSSSMGITSMASYKDTFGLKNSLNIGVIFSIVLIALLIHVELTEPFRGNRGIFGRLRGRFSGLSAILFIIFMGMVLTQIVMIIGRL